MKTTNDWNYLRTCAALSSFFNIAEYVYNGSIKNLSNIDTKQIDASFNERITPPRSAGEHH
jgi:hypothetical protein